MNHKIQLSKSHFKFPPLPISERLTYNKLDRSNYLEILNMFESDDSPFVIDTYKQKDLVEEYFDSYINITRVAAKRGGCDWLIRCKADNRYIGILNLFDLSLEKFNENNRKCTIGFNIAKELRRNYYATEAINHFVEYIFGNFEIIRIVAYTAKENYPAMALLDTIGFRQNNEAYIYPDKYNYYELWLR